jgi:Family of unknown function (DUF6338)
MPFNVLLLPLLGGYVFISYWNHTRFSARRYSGERLLFHAALAGVFLLVLSYTIVSLVSELWPNLAATWHRWVPFEHSGTSLGALLLGATLWWPLNLAYEKKGELRRTISDWNDYLEELLTDALDSTRQVSITLHTGKVYVGFVVRTFNPAYDRKYIVILPTMSGYRAATTHQLIFDTDYTRVYQALMEEDESRLVRGVNDFQIVVPVSQVVSANLFDWEAYQRFNEVSLEHEQ